MSKLTLDDIRKNCLDSCFYFAQLMNPNRYYGELHEAMFAEFSDLEQLDVLELTPRDHQKSHCLAVWCAWYLTKFPHHTIAYVSANSDLSVYQVGVIKMILESDMHRKLWSETLNWVKQTDGTYKHVPEYKWSELEFRTAHPKREGVREPCVKATSVGSTVTGFHFNVLALDDLVTAKNYNSEVERLKVERTYSEFATVATTGSLTRVVGTRYHEKDLYKAVLEKEKMVLFDDEGNVCGEELLFKVNCRVVEDRGDGTGNFIWCRKQMPSGEWYGFDMRELARKKAKYASNLEQFFAQYYNDPNDPSLAKLDRSQFNYYKPSALTRLEGNWYINKKKLSITVAMDIAYTDGKRSDWTAIVVVGQDSSGIFYVLGLDRVKTVDYNVIYQLVFDMQDKWDFRKIHVESNAGGKMIAEGLKREATRLSRFLAVSQHNRTRHEGTKSERMAQWLDPLYANQTIYHPQTGIIELLEEELLLSNPPHDDLKDTLATAIEKSRKPRAARRTNVVQLRTNKRFGGIHR